MGRPVKYNAADTRHLLEVPKTSEDIQAIVDYYIDQASFQTAEKSKLQVLYDAAEGIVDMETYKYVLNPFNTENTQLQQFPAKLRNYDIIKPVLNSYLGETGKKPNRPVVAIANSNAIDRKKQAKMDFFAEYFVQDLVNNLNEQGVETGVPSKEIPGYDQVNKRFELEYDDYRAMLGQEILDYLYYDKDIEDKRQELMWHWLVGGRAVTYKDTGFDDVSYEVCDPRDIYVIGWGNTSYLEDADAVVHVRRLTPQFLLENFRDDLEEHEDYEDIVNWLKEESSERSYQTDVVDMRNENLDRQSSRSYEGNEGMWGDKIRLYQVAVKLVKKVYLLHYMEEGTDTPKQMVVDDEYVLEPDKGDIELECFYVDEVWTMYRIEDKWTFGASPVDVQRHQVNNIGTCKLPYNGKILGYTNSEIYSIVKEGLHYQILVNIFMYRLELTMAKNKDKLVAFPLGLIPDGPDWDEDKFMYMSEALGYMFYDETSEKAAVAIQGIKEINMSFGQFVNQYWQLIDGVRNMFWDVIGMNRQRFGSTYASDGKANTEQAIFRSAIVTYDMFRQFDKLLEKDYQGLLDLTKVAFSNGGKKAQYISSEGYKKWFELSDDIALDYMETEFNVFVKNTTEEYEKLDRAKQYLLTMGQNGLGPEGMLEVLDATNISMAKQAAKDAMRIEREHAEKLQQQQGQQAQQIQQMQSQDKQLDREAKMYVADMQYRGMVEAAAINADADLVKIYNDTMTQIGDDTGELEQSMNDAEDRIAEYKQAFDREKHNDLVRLKEQDQQIKRESNATKERIAEENKNRYDK
jgi:hypothetical protein